MAGLGARWTPGWSPEPLAYLLRSGSTRKSEATATSCDVGLKNSSSSLLASNFSLPVFFKPSNSGGATALVMLH